MFKVNDKKQMLDYVLKIIQMTMKNYFSELDDGDDDESDGSR